MNELVKINQQQISPWQTFANDTLASAIAGDLLLYRKGDWSRGEDEKIAREDLGLMDETLWETDQDGKPRSPWQPVYRVVMRDQAGKLLTFSTSSWGGKKAVAKLCRDYDRSYQKHRCGEFPVVELGSKNRQSHERGIIKEPEFTIVAWDFWDDEAAEQTREVLAAPKTPDPATEKDEIEDAVDDEIPF